MAEENRVMQPNSTTPRSRKPIASQPAMDDFGRRGFLKLAGFGVSSALLAGCNRAPVEQAIPYLIQPEEAIPGRALFYATTCQACPASCGVLAKVVDGRPIKLEGSPEHSLSRGGLCAIGQASLLGLYDTLRLKHPLKNGQETDWSLVDDEIRQRLAEIRGRGGRVRFLTPTVASPTLRRVIGEFLEGFEDGLLVEFDPLSNSAILDAHLQTHGVRILPHYLFEQAAVIVSFDADFLGTWISPVEFAADYRKGRRLESDEETFSFHAQLEARMSLTGANADQRIPFPPYAVRPALAYLAGRLAPRAGWEVGPAAIQEADLDVGLLNELADRLWQSRGRSLVVCGSQDLESQVFCNALNAILGNYGTTLDVQRPSLQRQGSDLALVRLLRELGEGTVDALFINNMNPLHALPRSQELSEGVPRVPLVVDFAERADETSRLADFVCPVPHYLESWSDAEPVAGTVSLSQPVIRPMGQTRALTECLSAWMDRPGTSLDILKSHWKEFLLARAATDLNFEEFWDRSLHDGCVSVAPDQEPVSTFQADAWAWPDSPMNLTGAELTLVAYPKVGMLEGRHGYNAWLQELPDPVSKVTWGNYACLSPATADRLGLEEGAVVRLSTASGSLQLPVFHQPGQHDRVVAVALGYGTEHSERFAEIGPQWIEALPSVQADGRVGKNAAVLLDFKDGLLQFSGQSVELTPTGDFAALASTQDYHRIEVPEPLQLAGSQPRPIVQQTTLAALSAGAPLHQEHHSTEELWPDDHPFTGHHWGLAIDLEACTGCSACVVGCQVENNIPVVGKDEVARNREMHWLRIDRYYSRSNHQPDVAFQPMMCAQCDHAPCETVCPVLATVHSSEGLNQQIYNRCVGTRYCANNCPYKIRHFNWFDYAHQDPAANLVLNPNVTVRSRGVMEKCTFCVQRIQESRIEARSQGRDLADGDIQTACQQSCPSEAIVFGDMNDPESRISKLKTSPRAYRVLEELNVRPSVTYLALVRNRTEQPNEEQHG